MSILSIRPLFFPTAPLTKLSFKVSEIIYNASKGSKFFNHEEARDKVLTEKISRILSRKKHLDTLDLTRELRQADALITQLELTRDLSRIIVHVDCDAFYAAVEQLDRPDLADVPFAVGGGVLTTCNYAARRFGCRSGMAGFVAKRLCPDLTVLPLRFDRYRAVAADVRAVLARYDPRFEAASVDEAYVDLTAYCADNHLSPEDAVRRMRAEVHESARVTVSAGIAANTRLAKICSNVNKPDGQFLLPSDRPTVLAFMRDLPCRKVNGIGRVLERELAALGIRNCGDIYPQRQYLSRLFGDKVCEFLLRCYLALGRTSIQPAEEYERKSVGTESTFREMLDPAQLREKLRWTAAELEKDLRKAECKGRTLVLKVKLHTYEVYTRQVVPPRTLHLADDLYAYALPMLAKLQQEIPDMKLRLMGLRCTNLVSTKKPDALAFFGLKRRRSGSVDGAGQQDGKDIVARQLLPNRPGEVEEWEQWPDELLNEDHKEDETNVELLERQGVTGANIDPTDHRMGGITDEGDCSTAGGKGDSATRPLPDAEEEWWDCPICGRPQPAEERQFNDHIDMCLSRQAIRDVVQQQRQQQQDAAPVPDDTSSKRAKHGPERKRGRPPSHPGPRQKRLCFG